jgi:D-alanyl-D-alanine dipeptidase
MKKMLEGFLVLALALGLVACGDINYPTVDKVEVVQGEVIVSTVTPKTASETTIQEDVPTDAVFKIYFDETIDMASAQGKIDIRENPGDAVDVTLTARLNVVTATPARALKPELNHYLNIASGIDDVSGNPTLRAYKISFYTAP